MLSTTEKRYAEICIAQIEGKETNEQIADRFGVARSCVDRAIRWGRDRGLFDATVSEKLHLHIAELYTVMERMESALALHMEPPPKRKSRNGNHKKRVWKPNIHAIAGLARTLLDYRTRVMELEGIYKKVLNLQHTGADGGVMRIQYEAVQPDPAPSQN